MINAEKVLTASDLKMAFTAFLSMEQPSVARTSHFLVKLKTINHSLGKPVVFSSQVQYVSLFWDELYLTPFLVSGGTVFNNFMPSCPYQGFNSYN